MEITKIIYAAANSNTNVVVYIPIEICAYYMYFYIGYGLTKKYSFWNSVWTTAIFITSILVTVDLFIIPSTFHNGIRAIFRHEDDFYSWHSLIWHTIINISGVVFLIASAYKINRFNDLLKALIPLSILMLICYILATSANLHIDGYSNYSWFGFLESVYNGLGKIMALYNLVIFIIFTILFILAYYLYYVFSVLVPKSIKILNDRRKVSSQNISN